MSLRGIGPVVLLAVTVLTLGSCDLAPQQLSGERVTGGDPAQGLAIIKAGTHGCQACHAVPGIPTPKGVVGPPLEGMANRSFIAGHLPNRPGVMVAFLQNPSALHPGTGMPDVGLDLEQARHIAAYLYTLDVQDAW